jgi:hypothetical protein
MIGYCPTRKTSQSHEVFCIMHDLINGPDHLPLNGAREIAIAARILTDQGEPDLVRTFYLLEKGFLPASKLGKRSWVSTLGRIRAVYTGKATA